MASSQRNSVFGKINRAASEHVVVVELLLFFFLRCRCCHYCLITWFVLWLSSRRIKMYILYITRNLFRGCFLSLLFTFLLFSLLFSLSFIFCFLPFAVNPARQSEKALLVPEWDPGEAPAANTSLVQLDPQQTCL